jgi:hypothetical protein
MKQKTFKVSVYHEPGNTQKTSAEIFATTARQAAEEFVTTYFPNCQVWAGRLEGAKESAWLYSFPWNGSGQRIYVYEN